jgi:hypothetical protein
MSTRHHRIAEILPDGALAELLAGAPPEPQGAACRAAPRSFPPDARAIIHCPGRSVLTSGGRATACDWVLEFAPRSRPFTDPLMGWTGGTDPLAGQVRLRFPSREAAVAHARREGLPFTLHEPAEPRPAWCRAERAPEAAMQAGPFADPLFLLAWEHPDLAMPALDAVLPGPACTPAGRPEAVRHDGAAGPG